MSNSPSRPTVDQAPILHIDLDAFFASVEILDNPSLATQPVAVGGSGDRGVVASANYEARRFGVHSGMSSAMARRRCPSLVMLPGRFDRYEEYSSRFHDIVRDVTPAFEPLGLDEVFCDLRGLRRLRDDSVGIGEDLRGRLLRELGLRSGVGVARNKLFAKLASKAAKPRTESGRVAEGLGVVWVSPEMEKQWLDELGVRALWGVGPATAAKLESLGLVKVRDLARVDEVSLARHLGPSLAATLIGFARGDDPRQVESERRAKSIGHEETFARSLVGADEVSTELRGHAGIVARALRAQGVVAKRLNVIVRYDDLTQVSRSQTLPFGIDDDLAIHAVADALVASLVGGRSIRLLGLHVSVFVERDENPVQLAFDMNATPGTPQEDPLAVSRWRQTHFDALRDAIDEVRTRFGTEAVGTAGELGSDGLTVERQRGSHAFGPEAAGS